MVLSWQPLLSDGDADRMTRCVDKFGYVIDLETQTTELLCGVPGNERYRQEVVSHGSRVQIVLDGSALARGTLLIHYQGEHAAPHDTHILPISAINICYCSYIRNYLPVTS